MLFLLNDVVFDFDAQALAPPLDAARFRALTLNYVLDLGKELFSEDPLLHRNSPERARRLALLLSMKQPEINAALFVAPARGCHADLIAVRFCNLSIEVMAHLRARSQAGALDAVTCDNEVWRRLAA